MSKHQLSTSLNSQDSDDFEAAYSLAYITVLTHTDQGYNPMFTELLNTSTSVAVCSWPPHKQYFQLGFTSRALRLHPTTVSSHEGILLMPSQSTTSGCKAYLDVAVCSGSHSKPDSANSISDTTLRCHSGLLQAVYSGDRNSFNGTMVRRGVHFCQDPRQQY